MSVAAAPAIDRLFQAMCTASASDLHLCVGCDPAYQQSMFNWTSGNYR